MLQIIIEEPSTVDLTVQETVVTVEASPLAKSFATVAGAADVNMAGARDGALVSYRASTQKFEPNRLITVSTEDPFGGEHGDVWFKVKPA